MGSPSPSGSRRRRPGARGNPGAGHDPLRRASCRMCSHRPRKPEEPYALWTNHVTHAPRKRAAPKTVIHREVITGDHDRSRTRQPQWPILRSLGVSGGSATACPTHAAEVRHLRRLSPSGQGRHRWVAGDRRVASDLGVPVERSTLRFSWGVDRVVHAARDRACGLSSATAQAGGRRCVGARRL